MQIKHNLLNKNTTANRVSSRGNPVNLSLQPSLHLCKAPFGDRANKNSIVNRGSPICVRKRNPADCHHVFVWFCLWDSKFVFIIWFSRGSFGQPCYYIVFAIGVYMFDLILPPYWSYPLSFKQTISGCFWPIVCKLCVCSIYLNVVSQTLRSIFPFLSRHKFATWPSWIIGNCSASWNG